MKKILLCLLLSFGISSSFLKAEENSFIVCDNGYEMFLWDLQFIDQACHSIEIGACFAGGTIFRELAKHLEKRMDECPELQVYFLTTPILFETEDKKILKKFETKYPDRFHLEHSSNVVIIWPEVTGIDNHVKMMIIDETYFSCGGTNLDQSLCTEGTTTPPRNPNKGPPMGPSLPAGARDQDVVGRGPLAKEFRKSFYQFYSLWEHFNKTGKLERDPEFFADSSYYFPVDDFEKPFVPQFEWSPRLVRVPEDKVRMVIGGAHQKHNAITEEYVRLIKGAKDEIIIGNLYFYPTDVVFEAILDAVNRGVKLTLITNGTGEVPPYFNQYFAWANRVNYVPILYGKTFHFWESSACSKKPIKNTRIYEYNVSDIIYHKKVMLIDGKRVAIGSYNLGTKSDLSDYELILSIDSERIANHAREVFQKDLNYSIEIMPKEARGWYFDPFTAYLGEVQKRFHGLL